MTAATAQKNTGEKTGKGKSPASAATQFKPGESGNPAGRPKGALNYKTIAMKVWEEVAAEQAEAYNKKHAKAIKEGTDFERNAKHFFIPELLIKKHTIMALAGSEKALDSVQDRFFGKAVQTIVGDPDAPLEHSIEGKAERAARMLAMFDVPVVEDDEEDDDDEQDEVEPAAATASKKARAKKPAAPKAKTAKLPAAVTRSMPKARRSVSRRPVNPYAKKK